MLKKDSPSADLLFGSVAGVLGKFVEFPFDTIKVRLQTQPIASTTSAAAASAGILNPVGGTSALGAAGSPASQPFNGAIDCFIKTVRHEGVRGLYKVI